MKLSIIRVNFIDFSIIVRKKICTYNAIILHANFTGFGAKVKTIGEFYFFIV